MLLPLTIQTVWLLALGLLWLDAEHLASEERRHSAISWNFLQALQFRLGALSRHVTYVAMGDKGWTRKANKGERGLFASYKALDELCAAESPQIQELLRKVEEHSRAELDAVKGMSAGSNGQVPLSEMVKLKTALRMGIAHTEDECRLLDQLLEESRQNRAESKLRRERFKTLIYVGLAGNFALALIIAFLFNIGIIRRLSVLTENSQRLARRQGLLGAVSGDDEIAYLDSALHQASEELESAENHRRTIIEMVAHDMRSPLMSAQVSTEIIQQLGEGKLDEDARQKLGTVLGCNRNVLRLLNTLLSIERYQRNNEQVEASTFDLAAAVKEAFSQVQDAADEHSIKLACTSEKIMIEADRGKVIQMIENAIYTLLQHAPQESTINVALSCGSSEAEIRIEHKACVLDDYLAFQSDKDIFEESGINQLGARVLALKLAAKIVQIHAGKLTISSRQEEGSRITISLPLQVAKGSREAVQSADSTAQQSQAPAYKPLRSRMLQKGLSLALIPLAVGTIGMLILNKQMNELENLAASESRQSQVLMSVNTMLSHLIGMQTSLVGYIISSSATDRERALDFVDRFRKDAKLITEQTKEDPLESALTVDTLHTCNEFIERQLSFPPSGETPGLFGALSRFRSATEYYNRLLDNELAYIDHFRRLAKRLEENRQVQAQMHDFVFNGLIFLLTCNFFFGLFLTILFAKSIVKRLNVLVDNAKRMPALQELNKPVSGSDELAALDAIMHRTARELQTAASRRKEVIDIIADNMRTPLASARLALESESDTIESSFPDMGKKHLHAALKNFDHIVRLIDDLLELETVRAGRIELEETEFDLKDSLEQAVSSLTAICRPKQIEVSVECENIIVKADRTRLLQLLVNYLSNAIKFSPAGAAVKLSAQARGTTVKLSVTDNGPGMDESTRARVFDRFFQAETEKKSSGFGLGLPICQLIAQAHGGSVGVESTAGSGSTFWASLPIVVQQKEHAARS